MAPSLGVIQRCGVEELSPYLEPNQWLASFSYRYFHSFRDFNANGDEVNIPLIKNDTYVDLFDPSISYGVTRRLSLTWEIPFQYGSRTNAAEHDGIHVHTMRAFGLGDMRLTANVLLLDPVKNPNANISLGLGVKIPTGDDAVKDYSYRPTGPELRAVDPAIEPGDGGWGIILNGTAFAKVFPRTVTYLSGLYLINPRETNGVRTINYDVPPFTGGDPGLMVNSVPDQALARGGVSYTTWPSQGVSLSLGGRWEGIPAHDLIGGSDGWRLPGFSVSVEPGISWVHGRTYIGVTVPVAVYRYGIDSVPFDRIHSPLAGVASFSDYQINATVSVQF